VISNMGAANPLAAARAAAAIVRKLGLGPVKIAAVTGDDVLGQISAAAPLLEGGTVGEWPGELIAANAYLGLRAGQTIAATYPAAVIGMALYSGAMDPWAVADEFAE